MRTPSRRSLTALFALLAPLAFGAAVGCDDDLTPLHDGPAPPSPVDTPPVDPPPGRVCPTLVSSNAGGSVGGSSVDGGAATTFTFTGRVQDAPGDGRFAVTGDLGEALDGTVPTTGAGDYEVTIPLFCGASHVVLSWGADDCGLEVPVDVTTEGCTPTDIQVTLTWDALGQDFELHLVKPGGHINDQLTDCTWTTCILPSRLDWGAPGVESDDPVKDIDDVDSFGPENIHVAGPEAGTYTVMVEHWGSGSPDASGDVTIHVDGQPTTLHIDHLASMGVWAAATIDWPSGVVTPAAEITDCSASWVGGCTMSLP